MIESKDDYVEYLKCDQVALDKLEFSKPRYLHDEIWRFQRLLRKCEFYINCKSDLISKFYLKFLKWQYVQLSYKLGFSIPFNVFDKGLSIAHHGTIVVNQNSKIGEFCRIHEGVTIGISGDEYKTGISSTNIFFAPVIGDNVFIGTGSKIIGSVQIASNIAIGANSVVVDSFYDENITIGGIPARKISSKGSKQYINK